MTTHLKPGDPRRIRSPDRRPQLSLADYRGKKLSSISIPATNAGCTKQACALRDASGHSLRRRGRARVSTRASNRTRLHEEFRPQLSSARGRRRRVGRAYGVSRAGLVAKLKSAAGMADA